MELANKLLQLSRNLAFVVLLVVCTVFVLRLTSTVEQAQQTLVHIDTQLSIITADANSSFGGIDKVTKDTDKLLISLQKPISKILVHIDAVTARAQVTMGQLEEASRQAKLASLRQGEVADRTVQVLHDSSKSLTQLDQDLSDLDRLINDPTITQSLQSVASATKEVASTTEQIHKVVTYEVNQLTKPVKVWKKVGMAVLDLGYKFRGALGY